MDPTEIRGPDLSGVIADANAVGLRHVVIGGFAVIAHGYLRATKDSNLLVPSDPETDEAILRLFDRIEATRLSDGEVYTPQEIGAAGRLQVDSRRGAIDIARGGPPPLDYETASAHAIEGVWRGASFRVASLDTLVDLKRSTGRPGDRVDLEKLQGVNGELPIDPLPGIDDT